MKSMEKRKDEQTAPSMYHMEVLYLNEGLESNQTSPLKRALIVLKL